MLAMTGATALLAGNMIPRLPGSAKVTSTGGSLVCFATFARNHSSDFTASYCATDTIPRSRASCTAARVSTIRCSYASGSRPRPSRHVAPSLVTVAARPGRRRRSRRPPSQGGAAPSSQSAPSAGSPPACRRCVPPSGPARARQRDAAAWLMDCTRTLWTPAVQRCASTSPTCCCGSRTSPPAGALLDATKELPTNCGPSSWVDSIAPPSIL